MTENKTLALLKSAILLEKRGKAFYQKMANESTSDAVTSFFELMAEEEDKHIEILSNQFREYQTHQKLKVQEYEPYAGGDVAQTVLDKALMERIAAAGFEAAAISAAMAMEERAVKLYTQRAEETDDPGEKALCNWLAKWEAEHLNYLAKVDRELTESVWHDQGFWPF